MPSFVWDNKSGRYRDTSNKRFVSRNVVLKHLDLQGRRSKTYMQQTATKLVKREISLSQFQTQMIDEIKRSHIRMGLLASGGKDNISNVGYLGVGRSLKVQYRYLNNFAKAIASGELSEKQIISRAGMYSNSSSVAFSSSELINRKENNVTHAKRILDSQAKHCIPCIKHQRLKWTLIEQITPKGVNCKCLQNCKCRIVYKSKAVTS